MVDPALLQIRLDEALVTMADRQLVPAHEVIDLLLDLRLLLALPAPIEGEATPYALSG